MEPLGIVPMGDGVEPEWEYGIESLGVEDRTIVVRYRRGEHDEPLCCGSRIITDRITYRDGRFSLAGRDEISALTVINDFVEAVNTGDEDRASALATPDTVSAALSIVASGGPFSPCSTTDAVALGGASRYCFADQPDAAYQLVAEPAGDATWRITSLTLYGGA